MPSNAQKVGISAARYWPVLLIGLGLIVLAVVYDNVRPASPASAYHAPTAAPDGTPFAAPSYRDTGPSACTADDFSLSKLKGNVEYDVAKLTGIVTSHCASASGVRLKWTAFNADGTVAFSSDFWPASTTNIPPQADYPFEMMEAAPRGKWTYRVEPIGVTVW